MAYPVWYSSINALFFIIAKISKNWFKRLYADEDFGTILNRYCFVWGLNKKTSHSRRTWFLDLKFKSQELSNKSVGLLCCVYVLLFQLISVIGVFFVSAFLNNKRSMKITRLFIIRDWNSDFYTITIEHSYIYIYIWCWCWEIIRK